LPVRHVFKCKIAGVKYPPLAGKKNIRYSHAMLSLNPCSVPGCSRYAVTLRDVCYHHIEDKAAYLAELSAYMREQDKFIGLSLAYVPFDGIELKDKIFVLNDHHGASFKNVVLDNCAMDMCFFDYAVFDSCKVTGAKNTNCVFAGIGMRDSTFEDSILLLTNFDGGFFKDVVFRELSLNNSRFNGSRLEKVCFDDCDIENVDFRRSVRQNVTFKSSTNAADAIFDPGA
jgi:uncharacterized protein YjbI with pentapeptide repeats